METCKKCGHRHIATSYDSTVDVLVKRCSGCGYEWTQMPLDRKESPLLNRIWPWPADSK